MKALLLLITLFAAQVTYACMEASQIRLFPLGLCSEGVVSVEVSLFRTGDMPSEPYWGGTSHFVIYTGDFKLVRRDTIEHIASFPEEQFDSIINITFNKGLLLAQKIPDFSVTTPVSMRFCDYQQICSAASLSFDTVKNQVFIRLADKTKHPLSALFDTASIAFSVVQDFIVRYEVTKPSELPSDLFKHVLYVNSVRQFRIGTKKLTVVHVGSGQTMNLAEGGTYPPGNKEYKPKESFNDICRTVFMEPVLHHGTGFDFFVLQ